MENNETGAMTLNGYQKAAMTTCLDACRNIPYMLFNLQGEVGELSSKIAKLIRKEQLCFCSTDDCMRIIADRFSADVRRSTYEAIAAELGDVLWQLAGLCSVMDFPLEHIARMNLEKLASRQQRGVIAGEGDNR